METTEYRYLFPFEMVRPGQRVLIYGAGTLGQAYLKQALITGYCTVVGMVDRNYDRIPPMAVPVYGPHAIHTLDFDAVVIAKRVATGIQEVERVLDEEGVPSEKIVCVYERCLDSVSIWAGPDDPDDPGGYAWEKPGVSLAVLLTGGIGDNVIQKKILTELLAHLRDTDGGMDIFSIKNTDYLRWLFSDCPGVNSVREDLGSRYLSLAPRYAAALTIEGGLNFVQTDVLREDRLDAEHAALREKLGKLAAAEREEQLSLTTPMHISVSRRMFNGWNAYTGFRAWGAFDVPDWNVSIPVTRRAETFFETLRLGQYITVNCGNGESLDGSRVSKAWPQARFDRTVQRIKEAWPEVEIVQLGGRNALKLCHADRAILGEPLEYVAPVLRSALFHLDIEGGLVHLASQLGTTCVVLFGPTSPDFFRYPGNITVQAGTCSGCWGLYADNFKCARHMPEPECMYSITVDRVFAEIRVLMAEKYPGIKTAPGSPGRTEREGNP